MSTGELSPILIKNPYYSLIQNNLPKPFPPNLNLDQKDLALEPAKDFNNGLAAFIGLKRDLEGLIQDTIGSLKSLSTAIHSPKSDLETRLVVLTMQQERLMVSQLECNRLVGLTLQAVMTLISNGSIDRVQSQHEHERVPVQPQHEPERVPVQPERVPVQSQHERVNAGPSNNGAQCPIVDSTVQEDQSMDDFFECP